MSVAHARPRSRPGLQTKSARLEDLVKTYLGAAEVHPDRRDRIFRDAAATLGRIAQDPLNAPFRGVLEAAAFEFAGASASWREPPVIDDLHELLMDTALAREALGGSQEDFVVEAGRRVVADAHAPDGRVAISPRSLRNAALGRAGKFKFAPTEEERAVGVVAQDTLAFWQGDKEEAQAVTVDVGLLAPPVNPPGVDITSARPFAAVEFGSDGCKINVEFDVGFGARITVPGNYVSVLGGMRAPASGSASGMMTLGASIGMFAAPSLAPVTLTSYVDQLANGGVELIKRPLKASMLLPLQTDAVAGTTTVEFYDVVGVTLISRVTYQNGSTLATPVALAGDVGYVRVRNTTGGSANYRVIFQLSL